MADFRDSAGKKWSYTLNIGTVMRIKRADSRFNLFESDKLAEGVHKDLGDFWELLVHLVQPEDAEAFGEAMTPECLVLAQGSFFKEWADFFHALQRHNEAVALEKLGAYQKKAVELVKAKLDSPEMTELDRDVEQKMSETLNDSFTKLRESLALTRSD
jgi:hypothetical protein